MTLDASGNLIVGNTSSAYKLSAHVASSASNVNAIQATNNVNASFDVYLRNSTTTINAGGTGNLVFANTASVTERMRIDSAGNLGLGTITPAYKLTVQQGAKATTAAAASIGAFQTANTLGTELGLYVRQKTDATASNRWTGITSYDDGVGAAHLVLQDLGGNVGIGNTAPAFKLDVSGTVSGTTINASQPFIVNSLTATVSYSIPAGSSASSAGPITVNSGVTITVPSGSRWVVL
jgi:hypothetical protein